MRGLHYSAATLAPARCATSAPFTAAAIAYTPAIMTNPVSAMAASTRSKPPRLYNCAISCTAMPEVMNVRNYRTE